MTKRRKKEGVNLLSVIVVIIIVIVIISVIINKNKDKENNNELNFKNKENNTVISEKKNEEEIQQEEKYVEILEDGTKINTSSKLKANKKLDSLEIQDIQLTYKNGVTNLKATVENKNNKRIEMTEVEIELIDENGEKIYILQGVIQDIEAGKNTKLNCSITADFANAYDFKITKK